MSTRTRHREDADKAYEVQVDAGIKGGVRGSLVGVGLAILAHHSWPLFRRQTLAFKAQLVSAFAIAGLVISAEHALISYETIKRREENIIRREARLDLARQGIVGTETEIAKWRASRSLVQTTSPRNPGQDPEAQQPS